MSERYRHVKSGETYEVICNANMETTNELMVVYRNVRTGDRWVRSAKLFNTPGRFERLKEGDDLWQC